MIREGGRSQLRWGHVEFETPDGQLHADLDWAGVRGWD